MATELPYVAGHNLLYVPYEAISTTQLDACTIGLYSSASDRELDGGGSVGDGENE